jgi:hypothetical protein
MWALAINFRGSDRVKRLNWARQANIAMVLAVCSEIVGLKAPVVAADQAPPKALTCMFAEGRAQTYAAGTFKGEPAGQLSLELSDVNIETQSAQLIRPNGARAPVRLVRAVNAFHVLEVVAEGYLNVTTIYDRDDATKAYPAAHSRHVGILGQPVVSQYVGRCSAK